MSKEKKLAIAALCGLVVVIVAIILLIPSCDGERHSAAPEETSAAIQDNTIGETASENNVTAKSTLDSDVNHAADEPASNEPSEPASSSGGNSGSGSSPNSPTQKKWVPDYKKVWVEDSAAWDEQVPIYDEVEVSICNACGAEITGNEAPHAKAHALAGEGGGHHNDYRSVLVGYETVHHEATGHYETVENGGHWE